MHHNYTGDEKTNIIQWVSHAITILIERDSDLLDPNSIETEYKIEGQKEIDRAIHETTINNRLARYIEDLIPQYAHEDYRCDIEYNRFINQRKMVVSLQTGNHIEVRPDIIVHKRTRLYEELPHLLVVEAKKHSNNEKDRNHVHDIMADHNYRYKFGLLVSYYEDAQTVNCELFTLEDGTLNSTKFNVPKPKINDN